MIETPFINAYLVNHPDHTLEVETKAVNGEIMFTACIKSPMSTKPVHQSYTNKNVNWAIGLLEIALTPPKMTGLFNVDGDPMKQRPGSDQPFDYILEEEE